MKNRSSFKIFTTILSVFACIGLLPQMHAALPPEIPGNPDGCYPAFTTAEGCNALFLLGGGLGNTAVGWFSLFLANEASFNTGVGAGALALTTNASPTATNNTAVGTGAMLLNTDGRNNTALGTNALLFNDVGDANNAMGSFALHHNDNGDFNNAVGRAALFANDTGEQNNAFGDLALASNVDGPGNTAVGDNALDSNVSGDDNVAVGDEAGSGVHGSFNTAVGAFTLRASSSVSGVTAVGFTALSVNTTGTSLAAIGFEALRNNTTGSANTAMGDSALHNNTTGGANTAMGNSALHNNTTGGQNVAVGTNALANQAGDSTNNNTAVGFEAANFATSNGGNTVVGAFAGGTSNGISIGHNNTVVGAFSGEHMGIGNSNIYLGAGVDPGVAEQNFTRINDSNAQAAGSNSRVFLGSIDEVTNVGAAVDARTLFINTVTGQLGTTFNSSARFKKDIKPMDKASESILALRPVTFHYKGDKASRLCFGLIAEDVAKVDPALVELDEEGKPNSVRYQEIPIRLFNEFLKEHKKVEEQGAIIARQQKQIEALAAGLQKVSAQLEASKPVPQVVVNKP